jgi:hypothetical protein
MLHFPFSHLLFGCWLGGPALCTGTNDFEFAGRSSYAASYALACLSGVFSGGSAA